jgi:hypothetical protein
MPGPGQMEALHAAIEEFRLAEMEAQLSWRRDQLRFAAMFCCCRPYWEPRPDSYPHDGCPVHSVLMITPDGTVL